MKTRTYQITEVAEIAGVSARALRHYDEIGLLKPSFRSAAHYRLYTDADLLRLQQILIGRSLGLALEDIRKSIDDPNANRKALLLEQRSALIERAQTAARMIQSIDAALALIDRTDTEENATVDMKHIFDGFDPAQYEAEVEQRWGQTNAYAESTRRTRRYTQEDWARIKSASNEITQDAIALVRANVSSDDPRALDIAERHRLWVDRWFYPCSPSMHANLGELYQGDSRFAKHFDDQAPGLATFLSAAMHANAQRQKSM